MTYRILIVEDEPILTKLLSTYLQNHDYAVSVAYGGMLLPESST